MLAPEDKLNDADGILVIGAEKNPGRHIASAFMKLGKRTLLHLEESLDKEILRPLNTEILRSKKYYPGPTEIRSGNRAIKKMIICEGDNLSLGKPLSSEQVSELLKSLTELDTEMPELEKWVLISEYDSSENFEALKTASPNTHWILCPLMIGFRDNSIFDELISPLKKGGKLYVEWENSKENRNFAFATDLASTLLSAINQNKASSAITIRLRENIVGLSNLVSEFKNASPELELAPIMKYFRRANKIAQSISESESKKINQSELFSSLPTNLDLFPDSPTRPQRFFKQSKELCQREPELDLHFPPSRAL